MSSPLFSSVALIGAGNVATHLGVALVHIGLKITQVYSRTNASATALAQKLSALQSCEAACVTAVEQIRNDASLYVLALKDDVVPQLVPQLAKQLQGSDALVEHTAGSLQLTVLSGQFAHCGVLYPLQTFSKQRAVCFAQVPLFVEASNEADEQQLLSLAQAISLQVYRASSEQRLALHLAAVFACNFTNHLYALAADLLEQSGLPFEVLLPLIDETAAKVHTLAPKVAQTGPAVRYDRNVMAKHLAILASNPQLQTIYQQLSDSIHNKQIINN